MRWRHITLQVRDWAFPSAGRPLCAFHSIDRTTAGRNMNKYRFSLWVMIIQVNRAEITAWPLSLIETFGDFVIWAGSSTFNRLIPNHQFPIIHNPATSYVLTWFCFILDQLMKCPAAYRWITGQSEKHWSNRSNVHCFSTVFPVKPVSTNIGIIVSPCLLSK